MIAALIAKGFVEEVEANVLRGDSIWRNDADGRKLTLAATAATDAALDGGATEAAPVAPQRAAKAPRVRETAVARPKARKAAKAATAPPNGKARPGTKQARLIALLKRPRGASVAEIAQARGWLGIKVTGTEAFRKEAWAAARLAGLNVRGKAVLVQTANRLRTCLRDSDTAARFGGDEFAILLEQTRGEGEVMDVANRISAALGRPLQVEGKDVDLNASIGIARAQPQQNADEVLRNADVAMYHAKARGKACAVLYESGMHAAVLDRIELQADLRKAIERAELALVYQPIVELGTQQIIGAEALVRWNHPYRGLVSPMDFIPLAEETGLIVEIGEWVLRTAATDAATWPVPPGQQPVTITVNLSARQMVDGNFIDILKKTLATSKLDADRLVLELTESMLVGRNTDTLALLHRIRALGVRLAIDDFGTGYSSLGYLSQYPLDVLKIDRSFVQGMDQGPNGRALASAVVALGRSLKLKVVAEGIERAEQEWDLRNLGCDYGQGYLYSRPISCYQLADLLEIGEIGAPRPSTKPAVSGPLLPKRNSLNTPLALAAVHAAHQPVNASIVQSSATSLDSVMPDIPGAIAVPRDDADARKKSVA